MVNPRTYILSLRASDFEFPFHVRRLIHFIFRWFPNQRQNEIYETGLPRFASKIWSSSVLRYFIFSFQSNDRFKGNLLILKEIKKRKNWTMYHEGLKSSPFSFISISTSFMILLNSEKFNFNSRPHISQVRVHILHMHSITCKVNMTAAACVNTCHCNLSSRLEIADVRTLTFHLETYRKFHF